MGRKRGGKREKSSWLHIPNTVLLDDFKMKPKFSVIDQRKMGRGGRGGSVRDHCRQCNFVFLIVTQTLTNSVFLLGLLQSLPPLSTSEPHHLAKPHYFSLCSTPFITCNASASILAWSTNGLAELLGAELHDLPLAHNHGSLLGGGRKRTQCNSQYLTFSID